MLTNIVGTMAASITHRGPDSFGEWIGMESRVAIGHRRLSVIELSPAGAQPMHSVSGRYVIAFNGEIYNHLNLRGQLHVDIGQPIAWNGHSDTETLLACFETWGIEESLNRSVGMFAISVWDQKEKRLVLARDRMGEKPLYYGWCGDGFVFGSELKAVMHNPAVPRDLEPRAIEDYFTFGYIPEPRSIYRAVKKLEPGTYICAKRGQTFPSAR